MVKKQREKKKPLEGIKDYANRLGTPFPNQSQGLDRNDIKTSTISPEKNEGSTSNISTHTLVRRDLLFYEHILCKDFTNFIKFDGHALYFPTQDELQNIEYIAEEKKLLLPLRRDNALLAVLLLRNVKITKNLLPFLENLASICLEKMHLMKCARIDERCELLRLPYFMARVYREVSAIKKYYAQSIAQSYAQSASGIHALPSVSSFENTLESVQSETFQDNIHDSFHDTFHDKFSEKFYDNTWNSSHTERQTSLGLMVLPVLGLSYIRKYYGYNAAHNIFVKIAHEIKNRLPEDALCTMLDDDNFAVFYAGATKRIMDNLAMECTQIDVTVHAMPLPTMFASLENLMGDSMLFSTLFQEENQKRHEKQENPNKEFSKGVRINAKLCAGYSLFPQDWDGTMHSQERAEIPYILLNKARIAAKRLTDTPSKKGSALEQEEFHIAGQYLGYRQILSQSGNVLEILPYSQVRVNLGIQDGALENMCFSVWADLKRTQYKGEILLRQVSEHDALAQILMLSDPAKSLEEGDFLSYAPQSQSQSIVLEKGEIFYAYQDFIDVVSEHISSKQVKFFSLSLLRIQWDKLAQKLGKSLEETLMHKQRVSQPTEAKEKNYNKNNKKAENSQNTEENASEYAFDMKDVAKQLYRYLNAYNEKNSKHLEHNTSISPQNGEEGLELNDALLYGEESINNRMQSDRSIHSLIHPFIGSMSYNSILVYQPAMDAENARVLYEKVTKLIEEKFGVPCAIGIAIYPYLSLRPADMWDSCRKALDYAMLLPEPNVGVFDSLAINISADRKFSQGDIFGAVEEYRMALLADGNNILAWNSLGVCLAELGKHTEARNAFEVAYARNSKDAATCYNLGSANLSLGDTEKAKEYFLACLSLDNKHLYARIRLGEIAEKEEAFIQDAQEYELQSHAFEQYTLATKTNPDSSVPLRGLARLAMKKNQNERARELLQLALQKNSDDAVSLQLLAGLYLDGHEDAHLAEMLARQSVALLPWRRSAWNELARALEVQEKFSEAAQVRRNSMRL